MRGEVAEANEAQSLSRSMPIGWRQQRVSELAELVTSGSRGWASFYSQTGALFVRIGNLTREHINLRFNSVVWVQPPAGGEGKRTALEPGDVLISITADLGIIGVVPRDLGEAYVNQHIALVRVAHEKAEPRWVGHYLAGAESQRRIRLFDDAGAKAGLNLPTVRSLSVVLPPLPEQRRIAEVLDTIDEAIRKTEEIIAKLKQVKQGLLHDLLTRGIDDNGELRDPDRHPEQFKDSPLGRIPKAWEVAELRQLATLVTSGSRGWAAYYRNAGSVFVRSQNVRMGYLDFADRQHVAPPPGGEGQRTRLQPNDLLITITGNSVGNVAFVPGEWNESAFVSQHVGLVRLRDPQLAELAMNYLVHGSPGNQQLLDAQYGQSKPGLNLENLRSPAVPVPPTQERVGIVERLSSAQIRVQCEADYQSQLSALKRGLMEDLLTGRVRVTALLDEAAE